LLVQG